MRKKIVAIVQARLTSKRFPNKVIKKIGNLTMIEIIFHRLKKSRLIDQLVFAIPSNKKNKKLYEHLIQIKANVYRGSENNVLDRYYKAAKMYNASDIIRITADCPLIDPGFIDRMISKYLKKRSDYLTNGFPPNYSDGFDVEIFSFNTLKFTKKNASTKFDLEHVTPFIWRTKKFKKESMKLINNYGIKLSVDEKENLKQVKKIYRYFKPNIFFSVKDIFENNLHKKFFNKKIKKDYFFANKTKTGQKLWKKAKKVISGGNMLISKNPERYLPNMWPTYFKSAKGCKVTDLDNNEYIDFSLMGIGTNILGYGNPFVDAAVKKVIDKGNMSTLNCPEEVKLAEKLIELHPWFDMAKFARTGGEANSVAIRIARAASGKDNVAICGYHGWHDWYLSANLNSKEGNNLDNHLLRGLNIKGVPKKLKKTVFPFKYGNLEELNKIIKENNIGVIKMEICRNTEPNINFLKSVRKLANKNNIVLIFDECTTGFRQSLGGLHKNIDVRPDIAIFGKALGNGYAITAILGKRNIMENSQKSFISSTFWTDRVGPAAALKTIQVMQERKTWITITKIGKKIQDGWKELAGTLNLIIKVNGIPSLTNFTFPNNKNQIYKTLITQEMLKENFLATNTVYCSIKHNNLIIDRYFEKLENIFKTIKSCEEGDDVSRYLKSNISVKDFERFN